MATTFDFKSCLIEFVEYFDMHIDTIGMFLNFYTCMTFVDPSRKCLGFSRGQPKSKWFGIHQGTQKHFQTYVPRDWSRDLQAGLLL